MERWEFDIAREKIREEFWIDRKGKIHRWKGSLRSADGIVSMHFEIANILYPEMEYPDDYVYSLGWISFGSATMRRFKGEPTQAQLNTLHKLGRKTVRSDEGIVYEVKFKKLK